MYILWIILSHICIIYGLFYLTELEMISLRVFPLTGLELIDLGAFPLTEL